jgi:ankyrin repeat protein
MKLRSYFYALGARIGLDLNGEFQEACRERDGTKADAVLAAARGNTDLLDLDIALSRAVRAALPATVRKLLDAGADPNYNEGSPLRLAAQLGHTEIVSILIDRGADPNVGDGAALKTAAAHYRDATVQVLSYWIEQGKRQSADSDRQGQDHGAAPRPIR